MQGSIEYKIANYDEDYRPYDKSGGELKNPRWVKWPCKPKGDGLQVLLEYDKGLEVFSVWGLLLQKTTIETKPENRGRLLNHKGEPATVEEIAKSISLGKRVRFVEYALNTLVAMGWVIRTGISEEASDNFRKLPPKSSVVKSSVVKSKYKTEKIDYPAELNTPEFKKAFDEWIEYRTEIRKKLTPSTIRKQLNKLSKYSVVVAIATIDASITNSWIGLFPDKKEEKQDKRCVVDLMPGYKRQANRRGKLVYLCRDCYAAMGGENWGHLSVAQIERKVEQGRVKAKSQFKPTIEVPMKQVPSAKVNVNNRVNEEKDKLGVR